MTIRLAVTGKVEIWCSACDEQLVVLTAEQETSLYDWHTVLIVKGHVCPPMHPAQEAESQDVAE